MSDFPVPRSHYSFAGAAGVKENCGASIRTFARQTIDCAHMSPLSWDELTRLQTHLPSRAAFARARFAALSDRERENNMPRAYQSADWHQAYQLGAGLSFQAGRMDKRK